MNEHDQDQRSFWQKIRPNVLILMIVAYGTLVGVLGILIWSDVDPQVAFNLISTPLVALVGGTLAVVKDLL